MCTHVNKDIINAVFPHTFELDWKYFARINFYMLIRLRVIISIPEQKVFPPLISCTCAHDVMNLVLNFMLIKALFFQGYLQSHVFVLFFFFFFLSGIKLGWSCYQGVSEVITIVRYNKIDHRWADNRDKRFIMFPSHLFYGVGGISHDSFDREPLWESSHSIIHQTRWIFQERSVISLDFYRQ